MIFTTNLIKQDSYKSNPKYMYTDSMEFCTEFKTQKVSPPLYSLLPLRAKTHVFKMRLVVAGGGFLFYCTTQHIKLDMKSKFVEIKDFFSLID